MPSVSIRVCPGRRAAGGALSRAALLALTCSVAACGRLDIGPADGSVVPEGSVDGGPLGDEVPFFDVADAFDAERADGSDPHDALDAADGTPTDVIDDRSAASDTHDGSTDGALDGGTDASPDTPSDTPFDAPSDTPADAPLDAYDDPIAPDGAMLCRLPAPRAGGAGTCAPIAVSDYCAELPALPNAPVIDGVLECGLPLQRVRPLGWSGPGACPPAEYGLRMAVAWRPDGLYLFFDADSDGLRPSGRLAADYCGDGFELHVDDDGAFASAPNYDELGTRQFVVTAPADAVTPSRRGSAYRDTTSVPWTTANFLTVPRAGGYSVELFVRAVDLGLSRWSLAAGGRVGFDGALNVASRASGSGCEGRLGQFFARLDEAPGAPCGGAPHCNVRAFCRPALR